MKKVLTTIALSLSALLATSAMAAPQHDSRYDHNPHKSAPHWDAKDSKKWNLCVPNILVNKVPNKTNVVPILDPMQMQCNWDQVCPNACALTKLDHDQEFLHKI